MNGVTETAYEEDAMMQVGMIGLGRMGDGMVRRLLRWGHRHACVDLEKKP